MSMRPDGFEPEEKRWVRKSLLCTRVERGHVPGPFEPNHDSMDCEEHSEQTNDAQLRGVIRVIQGPFPPKHDTETWLQNLGSWRALLHHVRIGGFDPLFPKPGDGPVVVKQVIEGPPRLREVHPPASKVIRARQGDH